jgi:uncharacterized membrane protein YfcA
MFGPVIFGPVCLLEMDSKSLWTRAIGGLCGALVGIAALSAPIPQVDLFACCMGIYGGFVIVIFFLIFGRRPTVRLPKLDEYRAPRQMLTVVGSRLGTFSAGNFQAWAGYLHGVFTTSGGFVAILDARPRGASLFLGEGVRCSSSC